MHERRRRAIVWLPRARDRCLKKEGVVKERITICIVSEEKRGNLYALLRLSLSLSLSLKDEERDREREIRANYFLKPLSPHS